MATVISLYDNPKQVWGIFVSAYGLYFARPECSIPSTVYGKKHWVCDAPESLPKYICREMDKLVAKYGTELNSLRKMLRYSENNRAGAYTIVTNTSEARAVIKRYTEQEKGELRGEVYFNTRYKYIETQCVDDTVWVGGTFKVEYNGAIYRALYINGCFAPYLVKEFKVLNF